jgi:inosine-uridine nucleoside N-ribohydrolase
MLAKRAFLLSSLLTTALAAPSQSNGTTNQTRPKVIMDNDWNPTAFVLYAQVLRAGWDVIGLTSNTANTWARQTALHAVATLERGNLSCIPVYNGSDYPLLNTPKLFQAWEDVHGELPYEGAFAPENFNGEAGDPTSGDPTRIVAGAFLAGYPNGTANTEIGAAEFMVQSVRAHPGEISIYAAGALTNIALAVRMDPAFASNARELVIVGGFIDVKLLSLKPQSSATAPTRSSSTPASSPTSRRSPTMLTRASCATCT